MLSAEVQKKVESWLSGNYDEATKQELQQLIDSQNWAELNDAFYKDLEFGTGGLRGVMGVGSNRMNQYTVGMATQGLANYLKKAFPNQPISVAVAFDSRNNSAFFAQITANIFSANGIKVYLFENLRPTPQLSFAIRYFKCQSGVVITASHNPREYNGYKAYWNDGAQLIPPHDQNVIWEVEQMKIDDVNFNAQPQLIEKLSTDFDEIYLQTILNHLPNTALSQKHGKDLKIVYSSLHGTGIALVPKILEKQGFLNVSIVAEQAIPDGNFPTVVYPNPEEAEALTLALNKAKEIDADLILATDPDADRVGIAVKNLRNEWQLLNGNQTGVLLMYYLIQTYKEQGKLTGKEYIVKTIVTSYLIDQIAEKNGVECMNTLTGFKYIAELIRFFEGKKHFIAGGEESYGYLINDFVRDKDAISACAYIAEMTAWAKEKGFTLFELLVNIYVEYGFFLEKLVSLTKKGQQGAEEIKAIMENYRNNPPKTLAGIRVLKVRDYQKQTEKDVLTGELFPLEITHKSNVLQFITEDGSIISARPSGTEPKIKFYFSVRTQLSSTSEFEATEKLLQEKVANMANDLGI
ncbi:MAG: phospho-sugar mutase [Microscillaceae bacterium]|nr:phospho-sugar mutase [Microscillaceae bacterium]MDW8460641.1 phospho-sugar mutase [Cytophagales bacterium]